MFCPDDSQELRKIEYEAKIEVDQCPACLGMWLDSSELESIQETLDNEYTTELESIPNYFDKAHKLALARSEDRYECPKCNGEMDKREYGYCSQIMIDVCSDCRGVWLHKDEVKELEIFFERNKIETRKIRKGFLQSLTSLFS